MRLLLILGVACLSGCAILPRGPVEVHASKDFVGRQDGLVHEEVWKDSLFTRGFYVFSDPSVNTLRVWATNQTHLGGCFHIEAGSFSIVVDSNLVPVITASGTAAGNIIGAAAKAAVK